MEFVRTTDHKNSLGEYVKSYMIGDTCYLTRAGVLWSSIIQRVAKGHSAQKDRRRYVGTQNKFYDFACFAEWCNNQIGYLNKEANNTYWKIDKDIIEPFNTLYSPDHCAFVPNSLNCLFTYSSVSRGDYPLGVHVPSRAKSEYYVSQISSNGKKVHLGQFKTSEEAHRAWQKAKIKIFENAIDTYSGVVDNSVILGIQKHIQLIKDDIGANKETIR